MHIEFIDILRCPRPHEESWLIAAFNLMNGRLVVEGKLGCPVCKAEYPIVAGVADFGTPASAGEASAPDVSARITGAAKPSQSDDDVMRLAAMLGLSRPGMLVLLAGTTAQSSRQLAALVSGRVINVNAHADATGDSEAVGSVRTGTAFPIASRSVDGIALDDASSTLAVLTDACRVLKPGGRLTAPSSVSLPAGLRQLARDDLHIVAESVGELVALGR